MGSHADRSLLKVRVSDKDQSLAEASVADDYDVAMGLLSASSESEDDTEEDSDFEPSLIDHEQPVC